MPPKLSRLSRPTLLLASFSLAAQLYFMRQVHDFVLVLNGELPKPRTVHHATVVNSTLVELLGLTEDGRNSISETNMKNKRRKRTKHKRSKKSWHRGGNNEQGNCVAMYEWQETSFPSCNTIHEYNPFRDIMSLNTNDIEASLIAQGTYHDVWWFRDFKSLRWAIRYVHFFRWPLNTCILNCWSYLKHKELISTCLLVLRF